jgi:hypothetical protein
VRDRPLHEEAATVGRRITMYGSRVVCCGPFSADRDSMVSRDAASTRSRVARPRAANLSRSSHWHGRCESIHVGSRLAMAATGDERTSNEAALGVGGLLSRSVIEWTADRGARGAAFVLELQPQAFHAYARDAVCAVGIPTSPTSCTRMWRHLCSRPMYGSRRGFPDHAAVSRITPQLTHGHGGNRSSCGSSAVRHIGRGFEPPRFRSTSNPPT